MDEQWKNMPSEFLGLNKKEVDRYFDSITTSYETQKKELREEIRKALIRKQAVAKELEELKSKDAIPSTAMALVELSRKRLPGILALLAKAADEEISTDEQTTKDRLSAYDLAIEKYKIDIDNMKNGISVMVKSFAMPISEQGVPAEKQDDLPPPSATNTTDVPPETIDEQTESAPIIPAAPEIQPLIAPDITLPAENTADILEDRRIEFPIFTQAIHSNSWEADDGGETLTPKTTPPMGSMLAAEEPDDFLSFQSSSAFQMPEDATASSLVDHIPPILGIDWNFSDDEPSAAVVEAEKPAEAIDEKAAEPYTPEPAETTDEKTAELYTPEPVESPVEKAEADEPEREATPPKESTASESGTSTVVPQRIDQSKYKYILGKIAGEEMLDQNGELIIAKNEEITAEIIEKAQVAGKLSELIVNMLLPGLE